MNKVTTINLNGNAYQLEEAGSEALQTYLDKAAAKLHDNPDKDEIVGDLEQAIADKCQQYVHAHKNVITAKEIADILEQMGPVEDADTTEEASKAQSEQTQRPRRLFKIRDGAIFEGVCNGVAAYFDVDPTIIRVAFIVLTILTGGAWIAVYLLMAVFVPDARNYEAIAKAQGKPVTTQSVMQNAHERYEYWKKFGKEQQKKWQDYEHADKAYWQEKKAETKNWGKEYRTLAQKHAEHIKAHYAVKYADFDGLKKPSRVSRGFAGWFGGIAALITTLLTIGWFWGLITIFTTGALFGLFAGAASIYLVLFLMCAYCLVVMPVQIFTADALRHAKAQQQEVSFWSKFWSGVVWLFALVGAIILAYHVPQIHQAAVTAVHWVMNYFK